MHDSDGASLSWWKDPSVLERALKGHAETQNALFDYLAGMGVEGRRPKAGEPNYDLAWKVGARMFVAEIKSLTNNNEERQLRLGLGQVLRYRDLLSKGGKEVVGVLVGERSPTDASWFALCRALGVALVWPPGFTSSLADNLQDLLK